MARTSKSLLAFSGGEVTPLLAGRTDIEKASAACRTLQNMVVMPRGPVRRRAGLEYIGSVKGFAPGDPDVGQSVIVPFFQGYNYYDGAYQDGYAYEVFFGGNVTVFNDGRVRFVGSIRAGNRGLGGAATTVPYQVLVNDTLTTIQSATSDFVAVAVDTTLAAGSADTLKFVAGYILDASSHVPDFKLALLSYPDGSLFASGFDLPFDPTGITQGHGVSISVSGSTLNMVGRYADQAAFQGEQAALYTYAISNLSTAERSAEVIHIQTQINDDSHDYTASRVIGSNDVMVFLGSGSTLGNVSYPIGMYLGPFSPA